MHKQHLYIITVILRLQLLKVLVLRFIFYKIGRLKNLANQNPHLVNGTAFLYMDANNKEWSFSSVGAESANQAIGYTLTQYYKNIDDPDVSILVVY